MNFNWKTNYSRVKDRFIKSYLLKGSTLSFGAKIITFLLGFAFQIIIAQSLTLDQYGNYSYIMNLVFLSNTIAIFGLNTSAKKLIPSFIINNDTGRLQGFFIFSLIVILSLSVIVGVFDYLFLTYQKWNHEIEDALLIITILVLVTALVDFFSNSLFAFKQPFIGAISFNAIRYFVCILLIGALLFKSNLLSVDRLVHFTILGFVITIIIQILFVKKQVSSDFTSINFETAKWLRLSVGLLLVNSFFVIQNRIDIQLLGVYRTKEEVGLYNAIFRGSEMSRFVFKSVSSVSMPIISALFAQSAAKSVIQKKIRNITKVLFWPTFMIIGLIALFSKYFLLLFGQEFLQANNAFLILLIGQLLLAANGSAIMVLNMSGYHNLNLRIFIFASFINVLLNVMLIPHYGILGAAVSTSVVNFLIGFGSSYMVRKKLGLNTRII